MAKAPKKTSAGLSVGDQVPDFTLESTNGAFKLSEQKGRAIVLYFYPKDSTPGCTVEGHDFSNLKSKFEKLNVVVYGISRDSLKSHCNFKEKQGYKIELLSDPDELACGIFSVIKDKNMYGKKVRGIERSTFLISSKGQLKGEWRGVKVAGHADEVLEFAKNNL